MPKEVPRISDAEWQVMKVLWENGTLPSSEIIKKLKPFTAWSPKTIHTLISRLVKKKVVGFKNENNSSHYLYFPLFQEEECRQKVTESFLEKVYDGSLSLLVANFVKHEKLTEAEIEELKKLLEDNSN